MAKSKVRLVHEHSIGREWDSWAVENDKPVKGASGSNAFSFFKFVQKERPGLLSFSDSVDYKWRLVERFLKETGRVESKDEV